MRVLQVCPYDWHAPGGVQTHVRQLSEELIRRGHEVRVLAPAHRRADEPWVEIVGRPFCMPFNGTRAPICPRPAAAWRIRRALRAFDPTIVHAHEPLAPSLALYAGLLATAPVVATFHAHCDARLGRFLYGSATWPLNRRIAAGIAVSSAATRCLGSGVRVPFRVVPNGVEQQFFEIETRSARSGPRRILFAHRLEPRKGFGVALEAFARLVERAADVELVVVGEGPDRKLVERLPARARNGIHLRGVLDRRALVAQFAAADLFIAPATHGESFGVVLLEAMAAGLPVVASDVDGYRGVLGEGAASLVAPANPAALADAMAGVLGSVDLALRLASAGRRRAADYGWTRIAGVVEDVYDGAIASRSSARHRAAM